MKSKMATLPSSEDQQTEIPQEMMDWAETPMDLVRQVQEQQPGVDINQFAAGCAVDRILYDDGNCFYWDSYYDAVTARVNCEVLQIRMNWEVSLEGMPKEVIDLMTASAQKIFSDDWGNEAIYRVAKKEWQRMKNEIAKLADSKKPIGEDIGRLTEYYTAISGSL